MGWFSKIRLGIIFLVAFIVIVVFIGLLTSNRTVTTPVEGSISAVASPFEKFSYVVSLNLSNFVTDISEYSQLRGKNEENQVKINELEKKLAEYELKVNENTTLRGMIGFQNQNPQYNVLPAEVIAIDPANGISLMTINRGSNDGLGVDMAVMAGTDLVGKITQVSLTTAKVKTIIDPMSTLNGRSTRSGTYIRIEGDLNNELIGYIEPGMDVVSGDLVVTSGLYGTYPGDLFIGTVNKVEKQEGSLELKVSIIPGVDFRTINIVSILRQV